MGKVEAKEVLKYKTAKDNVYASSLLAFIHTTRYPGGEHLIAIQLMFRNVYSKLSQLKPNVRNAGM